MNNNSGNLNTHVYDDSALCHATPSVDCVNNS